MVRFRRLHAWRRPRFGFGLQLFVTLALSLGLVTAAAIPLLERTIRREAVEEGAGLARANARAIAHLVRITEGNREKGLEHATELLVALAAQPHVVDIRLIGPDRRTLASPRSSELGEVESERSVDEALRLGRSFAGWEGEAGDRGGDLQYVVPVDLPAGRHALELDQDAAFVDEQVGAARRLVLHGMVLAIAACIVLFYLLGGRRLSRLHRAALNRSRQDGLTDLGSQRAFHEELGRAVALAARHGDPLSIVTFDLDDFKLANDRYGHAHGDELLKRMGEILRRGRGSDRPFRVGGDEFALILPRTDAEGARRVARRVQRELAQTDGAGIRASIGVAQLGPGETDADVLYEQADAACYQVKRCGGNEVLAFCDLPAGLAAPAKAGALADLLEEGDLAVAFQAVCDLQTGQPIGYEALARPAQRYGFSGPAEAFATAERLRRVPELDALCCRRVFEHVDSLPEGRLLFLNLSPRSLKNDPHIEEQLARLALGAGFPPGRVVLEITEREEVAVATIVASVERLRAAGFQVALDDVGVGNSGLEILRLAIFDFVKIDRSIVAAAVSDTAARAVLLAVDTFARETGAFVIAEGVEDEDVLDFVRHLDDQRQPAGPLRRGGQGFALGLPTLAAPVRDTVVSRGDRSAEPAPAVAKT